MINEDIFKQMLVRYRNFSDLREDFIEKIEESNHQSVIELEIVRVQDPGVFHLQFFGNNSNLLGEASVVFYQGLITGILDFGRKEEEVFPFEVINKNLRFETLVNEFEQYIQVNIVTEI